MKTKLLVPIALLAYLAVACNTIAPGSDPLVVRAEQVRSAYTEIVDAYVTYEFNNRNMLYAIDSRFKAYADVLRQGAPVMIDRITELRDAFKTDSTTENQINLSNFVDMLAKRVAEITTNLARMKKGVF